jgi:hypothetical protein
MRMEDRMAHECATACYPHSCVTVRAMRIHAQAADRKI